MKAELIDAVGDDITAVNAARVSFDKQSDWERKHYDPITGEEDVALRELNEKDEKLIDYLAKHKHMGCFEHQVATLRLKVPLFVARQIQRHRTFSYNEVSRRYVKDNLEFYWPEYWRKAADNVKQGSSEEAVETLRIQGFKEQSVNDAAARLQDHALDLYEDMLEAGVCAEQARMILPQNLYTSFYMTGNLRNWIHFLKLRLDAHAQKEVQDIAEQVGNILSELYPASFKALMKYD